MTRQRCTITTTKKQNSSKLDTYMSLLSAACEDIWSDSGVVSNSTRCFDSTETLSMLLRPVY